jgi:hypothetical protein
MRRWRIELIDVNADASTDEPGELMLAADTPVAIEWSEAAKTDALRPSALTLRLNSHEDRRYIDLYRIEPCALRLNLYLSEPDEGDGAYDEESLYWSGTLDTELYEEPYAWRKDYELELTFADMGVLDRLYWQETGLLSIKAIIDTCVSAMGLDERVVPVRRLYGTSGGKLISTLNASDGSDIDFSTLYVDCANFFDEDGEGLSMQDVLEGVLLPFGLSITQKHGKLYLADLNAMAALKVHPEVEWMSDDAVLSVDKVYNNVELTFSPYADLDLIDGSLDADDILPDGKSPDDVGTPEDADPDWVNPYTVDSYTYYTGVNKSDATGIAPGFKLYIGRQTVDQFTTQGKLYRVEPIYSGNAEAGVITRAISPDLGSSTATANSNTIAYNGGFGLYDPTGANTTGSWSAGSGAIITTPRAYVSASDKGGKWGLRVNLSALIDPRYNPFETADDNNSKSNVDSWSERVNFAAIPMRLAVYDQPTGGTMIAYYTNSAVVLSKSYTGTRGWSTGANYGLANAYLCYYDFSDRKGSTGLNGWSDNKQSIGCYRKSLPVAWDKRPAGEVIALPPVSGWIELSIGYGLFQQNYKGEQKDVGGLVKWALFKAPKVSVVDSYGNDPDADDVVEAAYINRKAKEQLTLSTIVGTPPDSVPPSARGAIRLADGSRVEQFTRAGQTDRLERLLINTVYSHHAERHATLSGTVELLTGFYAYRERSMPGVLFGLLSERQDLLADTSEVLMAELSADEYCPNE